MGGCCCCSSKGTELNSAASYYYYPRASDERVPLSSHQGSASSLSAGLLVDTNLDTSIPDTYRPPPTPLPYDVAIGHPQTPPVAQEVVGNKTDAGPQTTNSDDAMGANTQEISSKDEDKKESDFELQNNLELDSVKDSEIELCKSKESVVVAAVVEDCPICLEEYDAENPRITTKCEHHFHLACILEWMERSETCPVCDQETIFNPPIG